MTGVLFILGGMHPLIISDTDHHARIDAGISCRKQRVRRHVQPDMLHRAERACTADRRTKRNLHRNLLIRRPLGVNLLVEADLLGDLGRRGSRIA